MNKLILCEGETDAILLSYYLEKVAGWKYSKKGPLDIVKKQENESVNWYKKDKDYLLICEVGGKDNFGRFFINTIQKPMVFSTGNAFEKIVFITDRDTRTTNEIEDSLIADMRGFFGDIRDKKWCENVYQDSYGINNTVETLLIVIPREHSGALETVMLDAISENAYDKVIVDKTASFLEQIRADAEKYICSDRLQMKAHLGVTWAVQFPEKVFSRIDEQIRHVQWEKYEVLQECFGMLMEM